MSKYNEPNIGKIIKPINIPGVSSALSKFSEIYDSKMMKERHRNTPHPMGKKVICDGVMFQNIAECAKVYGQDRTTMSRWLRGKYKMPQKFVKLGLRYYSEDD